MSRPKYHRARHLLDKLRMLHEVLGDGPWLEAARGRLDAAMGTETQLPWWVQGLKGSVHIPQYVGWMRERGVRGYHNRSARAQALRPFKAMRKALRRVVVE